MRIAFLLAWLCLGLLAAVRAETLPPSPQNYFNDYAGVTSRAVALHLNDELRQFEHDTSNQVVVAIFRRLDSDASIRDYTLRIANAWKVGQVERNNGVVLFIFTEPRQMYIQVGRGLEQAMPNSRCQQMIDEVIRPRFRAGDFDGGCIAGVGAILDATDGQSPNPARLGGNDFWRVGAILNATEGQYPNPAKLGGSDFWRGGAIPHATDGQSPNPAKPGGSDFWQVMAALGTFGLFLAGMVALLIRTIRKGMTATAPGYRRYAPGGAGVWWSTSGFSNPGSGGGGGGGFSGGGGSFGGGGAGGGW